jgi:predicted RNA binding protein YcfA (HicA-like mRNA interferase family)
MPPKIRELVRDLEKAGFQKIKTKSSHRKFTHPRFSGAVTLSGGDGDDAKPYQQKQIKLAVEVVNEGK